MTPTRLVLVACLAALASCNTYTQDLAPADPGAKVPGLSYTSATSEYRLGPEVEGPASWPALNEQQRRLGGHRGHLGDSPPEVPDTAPQRTDERFRRVPLPDASTKPR